MSGIVSDNQGRSSGLVKSTTVAEYDDDKLQSNIALLGFKTAVNGSLAKYNLQDQIIDEYEDATGIDAGASTNETLASGVYSGSGTATITQDADATGTDGDYTWYKWTDTAATGSYQTSIAHNHDIFVLAGGGGGGSNDGGGGGGAGGFKYFKQKTDVGTSAITITIGAGGAAAVDTDNNGSNGSNSSFGSLIATGGGGGGKHKNSGNVGGSGGGAGGRNNTAGSAGTANQGNAGGTTAPGNGGADDSGGGGGGAGGVGGNSAGNGGTGGAGGAGFTEGTSTVYDWTAADDSTETFDIDGLGVGYAGGGGAGSEGGSGGTATHGGAAAGATAVANKGGGGGGNQGPGGNQSQGAGGSGVVIVRRLTAGGISYNDMTLQSTDTTAMAEPDYADMVILMENNAGTATINTDIKGYISKDSGSTFTEGTLVDEGTWGTNKKIYAFHDLDISAQSGTSMCYKITTHNQSVSKITKIHATSIGWKA